LFPALAACYAHFFSGTALIHYIRALRDSTNQFETIDKQILAKIHAVSAGLKSLTFSNCLKFAGSNRLCCGGHGYSASSGLSQIIMEADAGCTYEGDNVILLLQTARYLLKCARTGASPYLDEFNINKYETSSLYKRFEDYFQVYSQLYDGFATEIANYLIDLISNGKTEYQAWNETSVQLTDLAKVNCY
jgi:acyl-CoA oxidase